MGRKGRRLRKLKQSHHANKHHLIWQRRNWQNSYGFLLRQAFVYELDVDIHNELHRNILHDIPRPPEAQLKRAWEVYQANKWLIEQYDIIQACEWLMWACEDKAWRACMERQLIFLKSNLGGYD